MADDLNLRMSLTFEPKMEALREVQEKLDDALYGSEPPTRRMAAEFEKA